MLQMIFCNSFRNIRNSSFVDLVKKSLRQRVETTGYFLIFVTFFTTIRCTKCTSYVQWFCSECNVVMTSTSKGRHIRNIHKAPVTLSPPITSAQQSVQRQSLTTPQNINLAIDGVYTTHPSQSLDTNTNNIDTFQRMNLLPTATLPSIDVIVPIVEVNPVALQTPIPIISLSQPILSDLDLQIQTPIIPSSQPILDIVTGLTSLNIEWYYFDIPNDTTQYILYRRNAQGKYIQIYKGNQRMCFHSQLNPGTVYPLLLTCSY